ncbi:unnamed protein product [Lactuca virosa]|uniref:Ubiquitin-like protease family profile domain-containing protein n=1 Tax=Lactuca virosa TaxID=75947 RepID=A0AAU9PI18_9ASTR|nr:unnamed protein product [Lactuca virosa]
MLHDAFKYVDEEPDSLKSLLEECDKPLYVGSKRHWVLGVLDMKSDNCYYLDSLSSSNFNMQLKQIVDSAMVLYATQSGSNKRVKLNWVNVTCPVQPGATECGYYMLRFMKEIVEEGIEVLVKDNVRI